MSDDPLIAMSFTFCGRDGRQVPCYRSETEALAAGHLTRRSHLAPHGGRPTPADAAPARDESEPA